MGGAGGGEEDVKKDGEGDDEDCGDNDGEGSGF